RQPAGDHSALRYDARPRLGASRRRERFCAAGGRGRGAKDPGGGRLRLLAVYTGPQPFAGVVVRTVFVSGIVVVRAVAVRVAVAIGIAGAVGLARVVGVAVVVVQLVVDVLIVVGVSFVVVADVEPLVVKPVAGVEIVRL